MNQKDKPVIFKGPFIKKIIKKEKTQTRRILSPSWFRCLDLEDPDDRAKAIAASPWQPGRRLWVRENFCFGNSEYVKKYKQNKWMGSPDPSTAEVYYQATESYPESLRWKPSIHMPRWACRLELKINSVRIERLNDISAADAISEGIDWPAAELFPECNASSKKITAFRHLWESINGSESWIENPWVWVIDFKKVAATGSIAR